MSIYADHAATTPVDPKVLKVMLPHLGESFHNPLALYQAGKRAKQALSEARSGIAKAIGVKDSEIILTAGGTESVNIAIHGVMRAWPSGSMVVSAIEHDAVIEPSRLYESRTVGVDNKGIVRLNELRKTIDDTTVLVSIMMVNNEIGTIQPLKEIAQLVKGIREERFKKGNDLPIYLHSDACQAPIYLDVHPKKIGIDLLTLNASKIYGPKQVGCLYVASGAKLRPFIQGGGQERGIRSGTQNVAGAVGFAKALEVAAQKRSAETTRMKVLQAEFIRGLQSLSPRISINGSLKKRIANNVHISIQGIDNERFLFELDEAGIQCGLGSACSMLDEEESHVLLAIGLSEKAASESLRFSFGRSTSKKDIEHVLKTIDALLKKY